MSETARRDGTEEPTEGRVAGIEKGTVEARQGFRGTHALWILIVSLTLAAIAAAFFYGFG